MVLLFFFFFSFNFQGHKAFKMESNRVTKNVWESGGMTEKLDKPL